MGSEVSGRIEHSIVSPHVKIEKGCQIYHSIMMNNSRIGKNCVIKNAIIDKECDIGDNVIIGEAESVPNEIFPEVLSSDITLIGKGVKIPAHTIIGKNCLIHSGRQPEDFTEDTLPSRGIL